MEEILLANGFTYKGFCSTCGGKAKEYRKVMGNRLIIVKTKGTLRNTREGQEWTEIGKATIYIGGSITRVSATEHLITTLQYMNLV